MKNYAVVDVESTIFQKGNPYAARNRLCLIGIRIDGVNHIWPVEYDNRPYSGALHDVQRLINSVDTLVLFNAKFDLAWLARYGIVLPSFVRVFDCQLAEFILDYQRTPFPSLNFALARHGLPPKSDVVENEYWSRGIDTTEIPLDVLVPYLNTDLERTEDLYVSQQKRLSGSVGQLCKLHMQDLQVLLEMEQNGLLLDWDGLARASQEAGEQLKKIDRVILSYLPDSSFSEWYNVASGEHTSALLYGGTLARNIGTPYQRTFKTGPRAGESVTSYRWRTEEFKFPRLVEPPEGSELKKEGFYSTDEQTLRTIKHARGEQGTHSRVLVESLLRRSGLEKLKNTYYDGLKNHLTKYDWSDGCLHGTFNQCRVVTGRLSSEKPNQQNFPDEINKYIISRYPTT